MFHFLHPVGRRFLSWLSARFLPWLGAGFVPQLRASLISGPVVPAVLGPCLVFLCVQKPPDLARRFRDVIRILWNRGI